MRNLVDYDETEDIADLLMGRKVVAVTHDSLSLDNGMVLRVLPNHGGCSCFAGDYDISALNKVDNVITKVEFDYPKPHSHEDTWDDDWTTKQYRIFVFAEHKQLLFEVDGEDGNGYYGTGFQLEVMV